MVVVDGNFELAVDPPVEVVHFAGAVEGASTVNLTVTNGSGGPLGWKVKCSDNNVIKIQPAVGVLQPGEAAALTLTSGPLGAPPAPQKIQILNVTTDAADPATAWAGGVETGKVELDAAFD